MTRWVVVADSQRGRIYEQELAVSELTEKQDLVHPASRLHDRETMSDRPGSDHGSVGQGRHPLPPKTDPKEHEQDLFAQQICEELEKGRNSGAFNYLLLIAPPGFLGRLRSAMGGELGKMVISEINKDLTAKSTGEIQEYLRANK